MQLIAPSAEYIDSYRAALAEFAEQCIGGFWHAFGPIDDAEQYVRRIANYPHR